jgi:hypothetical protein
MWRISGTFSNFTIGGVFSLCRFSSLALLLFESFNRRVFTIYADDSIVHTFILQKKRLGTYERITSIKFPHSTSTDSFEKHFHIANLCSPPPMHILKLSPKTNEKCTNIHTQCCSKFYEIQSVCWHCLPVVFKERFLQVLCELCPHGNLTSNAQCVVCLH